MTDAAFVVGVGATVVGVGLYDYRLALIVGGLIFLALSLVGYSRSGVTDDDPGTPTG